jgi:murein DD-endopeptidase MepM/ murein hydrolase activator NlpD
VETKYKIRILASICILNLVVNSSPSFAAPTYTFPIANCTVKYTHFHHDYPATDIQAKKGCSFVAPINGVVDEVVYKDVWNGKTNKGEDRGGLSVSIVGSDGVRYYGSHLSVVDTGIATGVAVVAGQKLGEVGATGSAKGTSPHLHFGISWPTKSGVWWVKRGMLYPWKFLDAWKAGKDLSPVNSIKSLKTKVGEIPPKPKG